MHSAWLLCSYKLPREPSRLRLAVWRRLRRIGAVMLHDGLWVLPKDAKTREDFDWLAEEIEERGGQALLWESRSVHPSQDPAIAELFRAEAQERYDELAAAAKQLSRLARRKTLTPRSLEQVLQRLRVLERGLRLERRRDYFHAPGRAAAQTAIRAAQEHLQARLGAPAKEGRLRAVGH